MVKADSRWFFFVYGQKSFNRIEYNGKLPVVLFLQSLYLLAQVFVGELFTFHG